ncbi:unnamed protein product [Camellia sinensis]
MGALGKWLKSLIGLKKTQSSHQGNVGNSGMGRKWRLWRSDKAGHVAASDSSFGVDDLFSAAVPIVVRATTKEFMVVRQEWAVIRIQTIFWAFLREVPQLQYGRLVAHNGLLQAIWPYSGHYCPTEENFMEFISFLEEHNVDLSNFMQFTSISPVIAIITITITIIIVPTITIIVIATINTPTPHDDCHHIAKMHKKKLHFGN